MGRHERAVGTRLPVCLTHSGRQYARQTGQKVRRAPTGARGIELGTWNFKLGAWSMVAECFSKSKMIWRRMTISKNVPKPQGAGDFALFGDSVAYLVTGIARDSRRVPRAMNLENSHGQTGRCV